MEQTVGAVNGETITCPTQLKDRKLNLAGFVSDNMRNICILAHVDHGKTCIADSLLTLNGLVNKRCVGKTKYLDDRPDEQDRQITMKCSAVSVGFNLQTDEKGPIPFLINLVDTPGHIDFSTEVIAATRICDGALIVVDVVEGVSPQTRLALKYAYDEKIKMILVINKLDRLILDLQLPANDMFLKMLYIVEQCNSYITSLEEFELTRFQEVAPNFELEELEIDEYFDPKKGNVIFASAIDNWGFTLRQIATTYLKMINGETVDTLTEKLWELDYYVSSKDKQIKPGASEKGKPNVFCQLVCGMLNHIYTTLAVKSDESAVPKIIDKLGLDANLLPLKFFNCKMKLKFIMEAWNPLAKTIATQCYHHIPAPSKLDDEKIKYLINLETYSFCPNSDYKLQRAITAFKTCSVRGPPIAYITKLVVDNKNKSPLLNEYVNADSKVNSEDSSNSAMDKIISRLRNVSFKEGQLQILALARIYSGVLHRKQQLTVLSSDYNLVECLLTEDSSSQRLQQLGKLTIENVYLLLGPDSKSVDSLGAGYICGITCTENFPIATATLANNAFTPPIIKQQRVEPIVYNVITPVEPRQSLLLRTGLQMLQQFDTCLRTFINELGEFVVTTAGKVHLEKCLMDLKKNFVDIEITVSPPIYSLRETVEQVVMFPISKTIELSPSCNINIELSVIALPKNIALIVQAYHTVLNMIQNQEVSSLTDICARAKMNQIRSAKTKTFTTETYEKVVSKLQSVINKAIRVDGTNTTVWNTIDVMNIMRVSSSKDNINLLINDVTGYSCNMFITHDEFDPRTYLYNYLVNAFNLACDIGPICKEPVSHCAFILSELNVVGPINSFLLMDSLLGNHIIQQLRQLFLDVILKEDIGVMEPMLEATIESEMQWLGGIYSEIHKRFGQVLPFDGLEEDSKYVKIRAYIPALDGEDFIIGIRKITAGSATVSMAFSHYKLTTGEIVDDDEDQAESGKSKLNIRADQLVKRVRSRKGIVIHDQVVSHAEKQRTLKKLAFTVYFFVVLTYFGFYFTFTKPLYVSII